MLKALSKHPEISLECLFFPSRESPMSLWVGVGVGAVLECLLNAVCKDWNEKGLEIGWLILCCCNPEKVDGLSWGGDVRKVDGLSWGGDVRVLT